MYALVDHKGAGKADSVTTLISGVDAPNGVAWRGGNLYVSGFAGGKGMVWRYDGADAAALAGEEAPPGGASTGGLLPSSTAVSNHTPLAGSGAGLLGGTIPAGTCFPLDRLRGTTQRVRTLPTAPSPSVPGIPGLAGKALRRASAVVTSALPGDTWHGVRFMRCVGGAAAAWLEGRQNAACAPQEGGRGRDPLGCPARQPRASLAAQPPGRIHLLPLPRQVWP